MKINLLLPCALGAFCLATTALAPVAQAAPKAKTTSSRLEIWPGQRTLVVLPIMVSDGFLSTGDDAAAATGGGGALAQALKPLLAPVLSESLRATGKFSPTRPYKFDPLLRRALAEQRITDDEANVFVETPGLVSAQGLLSKLGLDQPGMVAQVLITSLRVGGTQAAPTVQISVRGDLYVGDPGVAGGSEPFRTITTTSKPFGGVTPEDRIRAAATQAFADVAAAFVQPPTEFNLPLPLGDMMTGATPSSAATPTAPATSGSAAATPTAPAPTPQMPNGTMGVPVAPVLPGSTPPLGVN